MVTLLKYGYVANLFKNGKEYAKNEFKKTKFIIPYENAYDIWDIVINDNIKNTILTKNIKEIKNKRYGRICFINEPIFVESNDILKQIGNSGEKRLMNLIKDFHMANYEYTIYANHNVKFKKIEENIKLDEKKMYQTDFIIISQNQLFCVEMKNWSGEIEIDEFGNCLISKDEKKEKRGNPFSQNFTHVSFLAKLLSEKLGINNVKINNLVVFGRSSNLVKNNFHENLYDFLNYDGFHLYMQEKLKENEKAFIDPELISILIDLSDDKKIDFYEFFNESLYNIVNEEKQRKAFEEQELENKKQEVERTIQKEIQDYKNKRVFEEKRKIDESIYKDHEVELHRIKKEAEKKGIEDAYFEENRRKALEKEKKKKYLFDENSIFYHISINNSSFIIKGKLEFKKTCNNKYRSIFAVIHNLLIKNNKINTKTDVPKYFKDIEKNFNIDVRGNYNIIFEYMIVILIMIKNNHCELEEENNIVKVKFDCADQYDLNFVELAINYLNKLLCIFSELSNIATIKIIHVKSDETLIGSGDNKEVDIYIERSFERNVPDKTNNEIWVENIIRYSIDASKHYDSLLFLLNSFFNMNTFRKGQLESIVHILNNPSSNKLVLLPTGSGKSLIYYFVVLMQPRYSFVISPTSQLIDNQISNLDEKHGINNISYVKKDENFFISGKGQVIYILPEVLSNDSFARNMLNEKTRKSIFSFVLDEVHCLSIKSHDFRVEYLTLASRLRTFFDNSAFFGFTATADFSILKELKDNLVVEDSDILESNIGKNKLKYKFIHCNNYNSMLENCKKIISDCIGKTIVFVKNQQIAREIYDFLENENILLYDAKNDNRVIKDFNDGSYKALICDLTVGIGIDLKNLKNVIHFGVPFSIMDFVQQIGRTGREGGYCESFIIENIDNHTLDEFEDLCINKRIKKDHDKHNDLMITYENVFCKIDCLVKEKIADLVKKILINKNGKRYYLELSDISSTNNTYLFILKEIGLIKYWENNPNMIKISINEYADISYIKSRFRRYIELNGDKRRVEFTSIEDGILQFFDYFIAAYRQIKKTQFKDLINLLLKQQGEYNITDNINSMFENYFSLKFTSLLSIEDFLNNISLEEINLKYVNGEFNNDFAARISRITNMNFNTKYLKFLLNMKQSWDINELSELLNRMRFITKKLDFVIGFIEIILLNMDNSDECIMEFLSKLNGNIEKQILSKCILFSIDKIKEKNNKDILKLYYLANSIDWKF